jgi:hypothetical protein
LIRIKGRHYIFACVRKPGKIARRRGREYLRYRPLIFLRDSVVLIKIIIALVCGIPLAGFPGPFMLFRCVVHDKVQAETDSPVVALFGQPFQIFHRAQVRLYLAEVGYGVAAVVLFFRRVQQRHQMNIIDIALFDIIQLFPDALQISGKCVYIHHHSQQLVSTVPVRMLHPLLV